MSTMITPQLSYNHNFNLQNPCDRGNATTSSSTSLQNNSWFEDAEDAGYLDPSNYVVPVDISPPIRCSRSRTPPFVAMLPDTAFSSAKGCNQTSVGITSTARLAAVGGKKGLSTTHIALESRITAHTTERSTANDDNSAHSPGHIAARTVGDLEPQRTPASHELQEEAAANISLPTAIPLLGQSILLDEEFPITMHHTDIDTLFQAESHTAFDALLGDLLHGHAGAQQGPAHGTAPQSLPTPPRSPTIGPLALLAEAAETHSLAPPAPSHAKVSSRSASPYTSLSTGLGESIPQTSSAAQTSPSLRPSTPHRRRQRKEVSSSAVLPSPQTGVSKPQSVMVEQAYPPVDRTPTRKATKPGVLAKTARASALTLHRRTASDGTTVHSPSPFQSHSAHKPDEDLVLSDDATRKPALPWEPNPATLIEWHAIVKDYETRERKANPTFRLRAVHKFPPASLDHLPALIPSGAKYKFPKELPRVIQVAIRSSPGEKANVDEIYTALMRRWPELSLFTPKMSAKGKNTTKWDWQAQVRHILSTYDGFYRVKPDSATGQELNWRLPHAFSLRLSLHSKAEGQTDSKTPIKEADPRKMDEGKRKLDDDEGPGTEEAVSGSPSKRARPMEVESAPMKTSEPYQADTVERHDVSVSQDVFQALDFGRDSTKEAGVSAHGVAGEASQSLSDDVETAGPGPSFTDDPGWNGVDWDFSEQALLGSLDGSAYSMFGGYDVYANAWTTPSGTGIEFGAYDLATSFFGGPTGMEGEVMAGLTGMQGGGEGGGGGDGGTLRGEGTFEYSGPEHDGTEEMEIKEEEEELVM